MKTFLLNLIICLILYSQALSQTIILKTGDTHTNTSGQSEFVISREKMDTIVSKLSTAKLWKQEIEVLDSINIYNQKRIHELVFQDSILHDQLYIYKSLIKQKDIIIRQEYPFYKAKEAYIIYTIAALFCVAKMMSYVGG